MKLPIPAFILAVLLSLPVSAAETPPRPDGKRFLFIIDTSLAMGRQSKTMPEEVLKLFQSGLQGQLSEGATIGIWTYAEELQTGEFPMQLWKRGEGRMAVAKISEFLSTRKYAGFAEFTAVTGKMLAVARNSADLTIFVISDGSHNIHGTPYDELINAHFQEHGKEMRKLAVPFISVLQVQKGKFVNYAVNSPFKPVLIPQTPPLIVKSEQQPKPAPVSAPRSEPAPKPASRASAPMAQQTTNTPSTPAAGTRTVTVRAPGIPSQNSLKIVEKWPAPTPEKKPEVASTQPETVTNSGPNIETVTAEVSTIATESNKIAAVATASKPAKPVGAAAVPGTATKVVARTAETTLAQIEPEAGATTVPVVLATAKSSPITTTGLMIAIIALLLVLVVLMLVMLRRSRHTPQPSLISAYMDHNRIR